MLLKQRSPIKSQNRHGCPPPTLVSGVVAAARGAKGNCPP